MMDEIGVLAGIAFKPHGKLAPMVGTKPTPKSNFAAAGGTTTAPPPLNDFSLLPVDKLDSIFRSDVKNNKTEQSLNLLGDDDIFVSPVPISNEYKGIDLETVLNNTSNETNDRNSNSNNYDLLGLQSNKTGSGDDQVSSVENQENKESVIEDLIPGFEVAKPSEKGVESKIDLAPESNGPSTKSNSILENDPFIVFEPDATWPFTGPTEQATEKDPIRSSVDGLDDFVMGRDHNDSRTDDLDTFFRGVMQPKSAETERPTSTKQDSEIDLMFGEEKKTSPATNIGDNLHALFRDVTTSSEEFCEIEGESEERRKARLNRHIRTNARVAEALAEKNQRDLQNQQEQEEKHRLSETLDNEIKSWSQGKEGNLRALLSSLQQVLWPECNWRPVSLVDLITSDSVKKVYRKATLYVHPDKVQQKGANLQQKYIAEKVFDLLQEAWIKFNKEELQPR